MVLLLSFKSGSDLLHSSTGTEPLPSPPFSSLRSLLTDSLSRFNVGWISPWFLLPFLNYLARATASTAASEGGMSSLVWLSIAGMLALTTVFNTCGSS